MVGRWKYPLCDFLFLKRCKKKNKLLSVNQTFWFIQFYKVTQHSRCFCHTAAGWEATLDILAGRLLLTALRQIRLEKLWRHGMFLFCCFFYNAWIHDHPCVGTGWNSFTRLENVTWATIDIEVSSKTGKFQLWATCPIKAQWWGNCETKCISSSNNFCQTIKFSCCVTVSCRYNNNMNMLE